ncbi:MAG: LON peptidase substrate-binding domain-containing protein [Alphaproteobacteria bacterium]|nr:LON peptidase substrate-binding domain-containing protein [Alphaproteobacteria bacterium]
MLPIFPLMSVLLPGSSTQLKIFEPRYVALLLRCIENNETFGLVYCTNQKDEQGTMKRVGCEAFITDHQDMNDGTHKITVEGGRRFALGAIDTHPEGYYCAHVDYMSDTVDVDVEDPAMKAAGEFATIYEDLLASIEPDMVRVHLSEDVMPHDSYMLLNAMILPDDKRQAFLEIDSVKVRFQQIAELLRTEIQTLRFLLAEQDGMSAVTH